jgi:hypothetical protein
VFVDFATTRATYETFVDESHNFDVTGPESVLRGLTADDLVFDFCADDLTGLADGDTVGGWVARRGGLTASATGTPTYEAPDATVGTPSVAYGASGSDYHATTATIDWSTYTTATLISVCYTPTGAGASVRGPGAMRAGASGPVPTVGGACHYYFDDKVTGLHKADGAGGFVYERDADADAGQLRVIVTAHDTEAAASDEIRVWVDGAEETGTQNGSSGGNPWYSNLQALLGARGGPNEGLDGRLHRFVALPRALSADNAVQASNLLTRLAKAV